MIPAPTTGSLEGIDWFAFLARPRLPSPSAESLERLRDASILVTGAAGSIGSVLSLRLATLRPRQLVLVDASEQALCRLQSALARAALPLPSHILLANVANAAHIEEILALHRPQLIFHAAAYKHVPLLEANPLEALANNAVAVFTLLERAVNARVVLLSTDKAAAPASILGASKNIAEQLVLAHSGVALRLGNVLGTEGSVSEIFLRQIAAGGPVTITDRNAERYFLTCGEAVDLLLASAVAAQPATLLAPDLNRQHSIVSLAEFLISACSSLPKPAIAFTGLRPGDKLREALWSAPEHPSLPAESGCLGIEPQPVNSALLHRSVRLLEQALRRRDLPSAMEIGLELVPGYSPGAAIHALVQQAILGALPR